MSYHKIRTEVREEEIPCSPGSTLFSSVSLTATGGGGGSASSETDVDLDRLHGTSSGTGSGDDSSEASSVLGLKLGNLRGTLLDMYHNEQDGRQGRRRWSWSWSWLWSGSGSGSGSSLSSSSQSWRTCTESLKRAHVFLVGSVVANLVLLVVVAALCLRMAGSKVEEEGVPHRHGHHEPETLVQHSRPVDDLVYTPAEDILELRVENYYIGLPFGPGFPVSKYQGWPDDEKDKLWMKYWDGNHMRVNQSIARKLPHLSIHAPIEGHQDEYLMGIMAFHHLHCLSALRKYIYPRRYNASIVDPHTGAVNYEKWHHLDHCVEILRQSIECRPDTTARTFRWHPGGRMIPHEWVTHTCRNFDALQSWASEATVSVSTRTHVVDGVIVDDEGKEFPVQFEEIRNREPDGWAYTVDDL